MLPEDVARAMWRASHVTFLKRQHIAYEIGDSHGGIFGIVSGAIALRTDDGRGSAVFGHFLGRGAWFGEAPVLTGTDRVIGAVAATDCTLRTVSNATLRSLAERDPRVWQALGALAAMNAGTAIMSARALMVRDPKLRCVSVLRRIKIEFGTDTDIPIRQDELADMCALSRGAVSAILRDLETAGCLIRGYGGFRLTDRIDTEVADETV
ncbi:MAG: Crp/Fnr family transcriptional regulator [Pseudomonadota bacterium]